MTWRMGGSWVALTHGQFSCSHEPGSFPPACVTRRRSGPSRCRPRDPDTHLPCSIALELPPSSSPRLIVTSSAVGEE